MLHRRNFLRATAAAAAGSAIVPMLSSQAHASTARTAAQPPNTASLEGVRPFACLPFQGWTAPLLHMSSGWITAEDEMPAILDSEHWALDFEGPLYGQPILAMADGWAVAGFQSGIARGGAAPYDKDDALNPARDWKDPVNGRTGWLGYSGLFIELQMDVPIPGYQNATVQMFHLAGIHPDIAWVDVVRQADTLTWDGKPVHWWHPAGIAQPQAEIRKIATRVEKGQVLGWLGDTGINFGYNESFDPERHIVKPRNRLELPPWDLNGTGAKRTLAQKLAWAQTHIEFYAGRSEALSKIGRFDGMGQYAPITGRTGTSTYNNPYNPRPGKFVMGEHPAFKRDRHGNPVFAR